MSELSKRYAEDLRVAAKIEHEGLVRAFAQVPREAFLPPGPWQIAQPLDLHTPYRTTPDTGLEHIYQDVAIALDPSRLLNNGQPSAHARWIESVAPLPGDTVLHIGAGTGYYTAILAELVGPDGRVVAYEVDPDLAARARQSLKAWPGVRVEEGDGREVAGSYQVIYVNAGATHARKAWLSALEERGRLFLPLTAHVSRFPHGVGVAIAVVRQGAHWPARVVSSIGIFDCVGARDEALEPEIRKLLAPGAERIASLVIEPHERGRLCLVHREGFCLQRAETS